MTFDPIVCPLLITTLLFKRFFEVLSPDGDLTLSEQILNPVIRLDILCLLNLRGMEGRIKVIPC